jgi:hypothetical protein
MHGIASAWKKLKMILLLLGKCFEMKGMDVFLAPFFHN